MGKGQKKVIAVILLIALSISVCMPAAAAPGGADHRTQAEAYADAWIDYRESAIYDILDQKVRTDYYKEQNNRLEWGVSADLTVSLKQYPVGVDKNSEDYKKAAEAIKQSNRIHREFVFRADASGSVIRNVQVLTPSGNGFCPAIPYGYPGIVIRVNPKDISVTVNGYNLICDQPPVIIQGRTLVPLRAIFEALGAEVVWNPKTRTVFSFMGGTDVKLTIDNKTMYRNGAPIKLDVPGQIVNNRTMVPARAVAEAYRCRVDWSGLCRNVSVMAPDFITRMPEFNPPEGDSELTYVYNYERTQYVALPEGTENNGVIIFQDEGEGKKMYPAKELLNDGVYHFNRQVDPNTGVMKPAGEEAVLFRGIISMYCVKESAGKKENVYVVVDLTNGSILKNEVVSPDEI